MSIKLMTLVQSKTIGSPTTKAVLMYMADRANDDGIGIWVSKPTMAAHLEMGISTIKRQVKDLCDRGILAPQGKKNCSRGFTVDYSIDVEALSGLLDINIKGVQSEPRPEWTPKRVQSEPPRGSRVNPKPSLEPSIEPSLPPKVPQTVSGYERPNEGFERPMKEEFEAFWELFPNKVGKRTAKTAYEKARKRASFSHIMAGLLSYVNKTDDRPWCNPATWLNQDRWEDQPASQPQKQNGRNGAIQRFVDRHSEDESQTTIDGFIQ